MCLSGIQECLLNLNTKQVKLLYHEINARLVISGTDSVYIVPCLVVYSYVNIICDLKH